MALLYVRKLSPDATIPTHGSRQAAGYDLHAAEDVEIPPQSRRLVSTGIAIQLPESTYGRVAPRSGLAAKNSIDIGAGVIDADYRGEVKVLLINNSTSMKFRVAKGDRIAQLIVEKIHMVGIALVDELPQTQRGSDGFGSTGVKSIA